MATLGKVWLAISPNAKGFGLETKKDLKKELAGVAAQVAVTADTTRADSAVSRLQVRGEELTRTLGSMHAEIADKGGQASLIRLQLRAEKLTGQLGSMHADVEDRAALAKILALEAAADRLHSKLGNAGAGADELGGSAVGLGRDLGALSNVAFPALIGAGVAVSPVLVTAGFGLAGLGAAAAKTIAPILAAGTATTAARKALAGLDPAQRAAYTSLGALKTQFSGFARSLEPETLGLFTKGLGIAGGLLGDIAPVARATAKGLDGVLADLGADLHGAQWQAFFKFMADTAGPDIKLLGTAFISVLNVLPGLLEALQPIAEETIGLVTDFANLTSAVVNFGKSGDKVSASVGTNVGVLGFLAKAVANVSSFMRPGGVVAGAYKSAIAGIPSDQAAKAATRHAAAVKSAAAAMAAATPSATDLGHDIAILAGYTGTAANKATALNDAWLILVGNFASRETAVLNAQQAVQGFAAAIKQSGAGSLAAHQAFEQAVTSIGNIAAADQAAHAPARVLYGDILAQYDALRKKGPLNESERKQLDAIRRFLDIAAGSTIGWTKATTAAASTLQRNFLPQLAQLHALTPKTRADVDRFTNSVINTGTQSTATHGARARLITDLEAAGVSAKNAKTFVNNLQAAIDALHGKSVKISMDGSGLYTISGKIIAASQGKGGSGNAAGGLAAGGLIRMGSGPTADDVPAMLSKGELVIPAGMVRAGAADHLRGHLPGFASGGAVGSTKNLSPGFISGMYSTFQSTFQGAEVSAMRTSLKTAEAAARAAALAAFTASQVGNVGSGVARWAGLVRQALAMEHLSPGLLHNVLFQMQTESGGNPNAINLSDINAQHGDPSRGLMQTIGSTFRAYHWPGTSGNIYDPLANIAAALNYARHRYGPSLESGGLGIGSGHGYAAGGLVTTTGPTGGPAEVTALRNLLWKERHGEGADYLGMRSAFLHGPAKWHSKYAGLQLASLDTKQGATQKAYTALTGAGLTKPHLDKLASAAKAESLAALHATALHSPGWRSGLSGWLGQLAGTAGHGLPGGQLTTGPDGLGLPAITHTYGSDVSSSLQAFIDSVAAPFARGGQVRSFDRGGQWPSGTWGVNTSGRTETVIPAGGQPIEITLKWDMSRVPPGMDQRTLSAIRYTVKTKGGTGKGAVERAFGNR